MRKQTAEAPEEKPKCESAWPVPEVNPRKQAIPHPVPAPRRLTPASSMPCIPSSADSAETRLRAQSDSRGQSEFSWPEQEVGVKTFSTPHLLPLPSVTMEALSELKLKLGQKAKAHE